MRKILEVDLQKRIREIVAGMIYFKYGEVGLLGHKAV
jgi:hypothetical protein